MADKTVTIEIEVNNTDAILDEFQEVAKLAVQECGIQAESHAADYITAESAIDTGLLKNSITSAIGGGKARNKSYSADSKSKYTGKKPPKGHYNGNAPNDDPMQYTVYIGSNVSYAPLTI